VIGAAAVATPSTPTTMTIIGIMAAVLVAQTIVLVGSGWLRSRAILGPEASRKCAHIGSGLIALPLPWLFDRVWPVFLLCGIGFCALLALRATASLRRVDLLRATARGLHDVERPSLGDLLFPVAVATLFWLAHATPVLYALPLLALALADAAAALVGRRHPIGRYATAESHKSLAGSAAFAATTFALIVLPLVLFVPLDLPRATLIALSAAILLSIVEAISFRGLDNLLVPLLGYAILAVELTLPMPSLLLRCAVAVTLLVALLRIRPAGAMLPDAVAALALFLYAVWAIGGPAWLAPAGLATMIVVLAFRAAARAKEDAHIAPRGAPVVVAMTLASLVWMVLAATVASTERHDSTAFAGALAMATAMLVSTALASRWRAALAGLPPLTIAWMTLPTMAHSPVAVGAAGACAIAAGIWPIDLADERLRWAVRSLLILAASIIMAFMPSLIGPSHA
jgi:phytol kinase